MSLTHGKTSRLHSCWSFYDNLCNALGRQPITGSVLVREWAFWIVKRFQVYVLEISRIVGAHPTAVVIVAHVRKGKAQTCVAGKIPTFVTMNVSFINLPRAKEGQMRINEKHRITARSLARAHNPAIGSHILLQLGADFSRTEFRRPEVVISCEAVLIIVVTNEGECVPRFNLLQQPRRYFRVPSEIVVEAGGEAVANGTHMGIKAFILLTREPRNFQRVISPILI